jgi:DNA-binding NarL/FixJ family response regulator
MPPIRVAIIEDQHITRGAFERFINLSADCRCVCGCATAEEALQVVPALKPDVVLIDIQPPGLSGAECAAKLKELLPSAQIIMVTVREDPETIFGALRAGASGYMLKSETPGTILEAIREVQRGGVPMSAGIARKVIAFFHGQGTAARETDHLSKREREVLDLVALGFSNKEIAGQLGISLDGVLWHLKHVYQKLHVHSRVEAVLKLRPRA